MVVAGVLGLAINDATAGYRAYRTSALVEEMDYQSVTTDGYGFQIEMAYKVRGLGEQVIELPAELDDLVHQMLAKQSAQRPAMTEVAALLPSTVVLSAAVTDCESAPLLPV